MARNKKKAEKDKVVIPEEIRNDNPKNKKKRKVPFKQSKFYANRYIHLMVFIVVVFFLVFRYWPITWNAIAFKDFKVLKGFWKSDWVGLENFRRLFNNMSYFGRLVRNTLAMNGLNLLLGFPAPIIFALLLNEIWNDTFKRSVQTVSYLPHFISTVVVVGLTQSLLSPSLGLINNIIAKLGGERVNFLAEPSYFWILMIVVGVWQSVGWSAIIYLSALTSIDPELYEAAQIDGANRWQQTIYITLPGIKNVIMIMLILQIGSLMAVNTEKIYLFQNDLNLTTSEMFGTYTYKLGIVNGDYSRAATAGLFSSILSLILVSIANFVSNRYTDVSIV